MYSVPYLLSLCLTIVSSAALKAATAVGCIITGIFPVSSYTMSAIAYRAVVFPVPAPPVSTVIPPA